MENHFCYVCRPFPEFYYFSADQGTFNPFKTNINTYSQSTCSANHMAGLQMKGTLFANEFGILNNNSPIQNKFIDLIV